MGTTAWFVMGLAYGMTIGFVITLISIKLGVRSQKKEAALFRKLDLKYAGFDEEECEEYHLAGDCPLCGAK